MTLLGLGFPETNETATLETEAIERSAERRGTQRKCQQGVAAAAAGLSLTPSQAALPVHSTLYPVTPFGSTS